MNFEGSEKVENSKGFECKNMGDVLGKECEKKETLTKSVDVLRGDTEGAASSGSGSESDSDKDLSVDSDEDLSWLLSINTMDVTKKCECEGCLKLFELDNYDQKNVKLLFSSWKEFRNYIRNIYINSPLESSQKNIVSFEENERLHEIIQVMRLCDPYQLFEKIEDEVCSMVLESRIRQLNLLKDENNPALAEEFITGLIEEYVKLLSSALQLSPAIENLLGPQLQRFGLTWEVLNKQLYRSLVYNHFDVQQNLVRFIEQLRKMLPLKDDLYHELVHQYLAFDGEMTLIGKMWKNVEPLIQEYRNLKSKENEKLNNLLDAMKSLLANRLCASEKDLEEVNIGNVCSTSEDAMQYCPLCMTRRGCPCDDCTVAHMSCEDLLQRIESPLDGHTPSRSRSRSPIKQSENETRERRGGGGGEDQQQQSCECHACTMPSPDLMDCSEAFNQASGKSNTRGEDFQLYPHIHGTTSEAENVSNIYGSLQTTTDSVYPHLYNSHNQKNLDDNQAQINNSIRNQLMQAMVSNKTNSQTHHSPVSPPPPPPPPPPSKESTPAMKPTEKSSEPQKNSSKNPVKLTPEKISSAKKPVENCVPCDSVKESISDESKSYNSKVEEKKNGLRKTLSSSKDNEAVEKVSAEKPLNKSQGSNKGNGCVISGLCGKCCLKHGTSCLKTSGCNKSSDKHLAAIARLGLSGNSCTRNSMRCVGGKDEHGHRTAKSHSCNKTKHQENLKKSASKKNSEVEDSTSPEDSCSEASNSTSTSVQKDPRHCDCCYCEVFGHGVPSVAPVSRNYQEMRERLRLRLSMKKSAKCKTFQSGQVPQQTGQKIAGVKPKPQLNAPFLDPKKDQDLESLLKYIEGEKKSECKDTKKAAKRARQKRKKQEEKEKLEEKEEERKRLEAVKRQVTISLVNDNSKRSQNFKPAPQPKPTPPQKIQPQTLNLSGLKSLVEKSDPNAVPKMVTIRRVMAPFSAEPTVTITLKGSTPDKDKVLFMLKNGNETTLQPEEKENSKKKKKKKKKAKTQEEEEENDYEMDYQPTYPPSVENLLSKKKKRKNKNSEVLNTVSEVPKRLQTNKLLTENNSSNKNSKVKNAKNAENTPVLKNAKPSSTSARTLQNAPVSKSQVLNKKSAEVVASKVKSQKNVSVLKAQNQNVKSQESVKKTTKTVSNVGSKQSVHDDKSSECSSSCNSSNRQVIKNNNDSCENVSVSKNSKKGVAVSTEKTQNSNSTNSQKTKKEKNQNNLVSGLSEKERQSKGLKIDSGQPVRNIDIAQAKNLMLNKQVNHKNAKSVVQVSQKPLINQCRQNIEIIPTQSKSETTSKKNKSNKKNLMDDVEMNWKNPAEGLDKGKVIINTPSYRLSEVLNSIAPSPPPKEEINLENLRLPPGITITKIEGPIQKPIKPTIQPTSVPKPAPPIVMSTPTLKPNPPPGNVIVVDTGRLKEVIKENSHLTSSADTNTTVSGKKKKKKKKQQTENVVPTIEVPVNQPKFGSKVPKNFAPLNRPEMAMVSNMDSRKMIPLENQQATIIKTCDNMVTIRSPALQQAMNIHAYQNSHNYKGGINGYSNMSLFNEEVSRINDKISNLKIGIESDNPLSRQMQNLSIEEANCADEVFSHAAVAASSQSSQGSTKKKKKKKKQGKHGDEREVEPVESVFQPKDIDLENGDIDDDERELEAFKRFCFQSIPPERKDKVKVNLNIKDIVLKKKSSAIGCS